ncbi:MAG: glycerate kinase, partial [Microcystaceae cyanobacterium]
MRLLVAPDSFKGTLSATVVCEIVATELADAFTVISHPLADGGEGTLDAIAASLPHSELVNLLVSGPLFKSKVTAKYLWLTESQEAFIEMAEASGLTLLKEAERNPEITTTYGTGELILDAIQRGAKKIYLAIGGSATNDAGLGLLTALGWQFLNAQGTAIALGGLGLIDLAEIVEPKNLILPPITVLCDVNNPLYGEQGAAYIYAPQKGADPSMVERLDQGLRNFAAVINRQFSLDLNFAGAGAAGGLGAGAKWGLKAEITNGFRAIAALTGLAEKLKTCDLVITGEGQLDNQSLQGKVISGILKLSKEYHKPMVVIAGISKLVNHPDIEKIITLAG